MAVTVVHPFVVIVCSCTLKIVEDSAAVIALLVADFRLLLFSDLDPDFSFFFQISVMIAEFWVGS